MQKKSYKTLKNSDFLELNRLVYTTAVITCKEYNNDTKTIETNKTKEQTDMPKSMYHLEELKNRVRREKNKSTALIKCKIEKQFTLMSVR